MDTLSVKHIQNSKKQIFWIILLCVSTLFLSIVALGQGSSSSLDMWKTARIILGMDEATTLQSNIIWELRFPRVLMAIIAGVALATAGALMQGCLGNPLVSPLTLGVSSGAALGAATAIIVGYSVVNIPELMVVGNAFLFSLIVVGIIIKLGDMNSISAESYILVGIAITFISGAIVSTLQYFASDEQLSQLAHWSFGSLSRPDLVNVLYISYVYYYYFQLR